MASNGRCRLDGKNASTTRSTRAAPSWCNTRSSRAGFGTWTSLYVHLLACTLCSTSSLSSQKPPSPHLRVSPLVVFAAIQDSTLLPHPRLSRNCMLDERLIVRFQVYAPNSNVMHSNLGTTGDNVVLFPRCVHVLVPSPPSLPASHHLLASTQSHRGASTVLWQQDVDLDREGGGRSHQRQHQTFRPSTYVGCSSSPAEAEPFRTHHYLTQHRSRGPIGVEHMEAKEEHQRHQR